MSMPANPRITAITISGVDFVPAKSQNGPANTAMARPPAVISGRRPSRSHSRPQDGTPKMETAEATVMAMTATLSGGPSSWWG
ncbi:hypothetical protein QR300_40820 [Streptomyces antimycoticus]|nr:hypothetical protein [Streptomyces antimycoticus]WJE01763.1 hypothetical protein QR300_40820 [Streptomyces antimycoticus]